MKKVLQFNPIYTQNDLVASGELDGFFLEKLFITHLKTSKKTTIDFLESIDNQLVILWDGSIVCIDSSKSFQIDYSSNSELLIISISKNWVKEFLPSAIQNFDSSCQIEAPFSFDFDNKNQAELLHKCFELIEIVLKNLNKNAENNPLEIHSKDLETLIKIKDKYLNRNDLGKNIIASMASEAGMSQTKFKMVFQKTFGDSPYHYFWKYKMELAKKLIAQNVPSIEVAKQLGYTNSSNLMKAFRKFEKEK
jgi:AraC-like DNA-binding protein